MLRVFAIVSMHLPSLGHGEHGDVVSQFVMHELESVLAAHPSLLDDPANALKESYVKVDESLAAAKVCTCKWFSSMHAVWTRFDACVVFGVYFFPQGWVGAYITCAVMK